MILAQEIAGIPITLPGWTQTVAYLLLALLALALAVAVWRTFLVQRDRSQLAEVHAKTNLILMILRGWQQGTPDADPEQLPNEHYAADPVPESDERAYAPQSVSSPPSGAHRLSDTEITFDHGRMLR